MKKLWLVLLLCLISVPWNVFLFLASPWGAERLAGVAARLFAREFQGRLLLGELRFDGPGQLRIEPILFVDPAGEPAASVRALHLRFSPLALLGGKARVEELRLERPLVRIAADDPLGGLGAVFLPRQPPAPGPPGEAPPPRSPLPIHLSALRLEEGGFLLSTREGEPQVWADEIEVFAEGSWEDEHARLSLYLGAAAHLPVGAPLHLRLRAELVGWDLTLSELYVSLGETEVWAKGEGDLNELRGDVEISGVVSPREARDVGVSISRRLPFSGDFHLSRESRGSLVISPRQGGEVLVEVESEDFLRYRGGFTLRQTDPSAFLQGAPRGRLNGRGSFQATLEGRPELRFSLRLDQGRPIGPGRIRGRLHGAGIEVDELALELPGASAQGEGRLRGKELRLRLRLNLQDLRFLARSLASSLGTSLPELEGEGWVDITMEGAIADPSFEVSARFPRLFLRELRLWDLRLQGGGRLDPLRGRLEARASALAWGGLDLERIRLDLSRDEGGLVRFRFEADDQGERDAVIGGGELRLVDERIQAEGELAASGIGALSLRGHLPARALRAKDPLDLEVQVDPLDLGRLGAWLGLRLPPGILRSRLWLGGTAGRPSASWNTLVTGLRPLIDRGPGIDAQLLFALEAGEADLSASAWDRAGTRLLDLSAHSPLNPLRLLRQPEAALRELLSTPEATASLRLQGLDLAAWSPLSTPGLRGTLMAAVELQGPPISPVGDAKVEIAAGPLGPLRKLDLGLAARSTLEEVRFDLLVRSMEEAPLRLVASAGVPLSELFAFGPDTPLSIYWELPAFDLSTLPMEEALSGLLSSRGQLRGSLSELRGQALLDARALTYGRTPMGSVGARLELRPELDLNLFAIDPEAGTLIATLRMRDGALPLWKPEAFASLAWEMDLNADAFSLAPLAVLPGLATVEGKLFADLSAGGRMDEIFPTGKLEIQEGAIQPVGGLRYDRIGLRAALEPGRVDLSLLEAHGREGIAVLRGELVGAPTDFEFDLRLRSRDFPVGGSQGVAALVSTRGSIEGEFDEALRATIALEGATVELPSLGGRQLHDFAPPEDVLIFPEKKTGPKARGEFALALRLEMDEPVRVRAPDLSLDVELGLALRRPVGGEVLATGAAEAQGGQVSLFGRSFTVEPSRVQWTESPLDNPALDLTARFQTVGATAWVDVGGTVAAPVVNLRSDPPMSEGEIALLIAAGGAPTPGGLTPTEGEPVDETETGLGAAASLLGSVAADRVLQALGPGVPIDVLTVEAAAGRTLLQAGTRIGPRLYLGYARNLFPEPWENANEVRLSYQLSRTLAVESSFGDAGNGGVDLVWVEQFPTATQRERRKAGAEDEEESAASLESPCDSHGEAVLACARWTLGRAWSCSPGDGSAPRAGSSMPRARGGSRRASSTLRIAPPTSTAIAPAWSGEESRSVDSTSSSPAWSQSRRTPWPCSTTSSSRAPGF